MSIKSRRKFLQGGLALGAMTPLVLANQAHAHGSRLKDNKDQEFIIVSIVATHPFWNDLKNGAQDAADDLGVKFSYVGPAGFDIEGQVQAMEQVIIKNPAGIGHVHSTDAAYPSIQKALDAGIPVMAVTSTGANTPCLGYIGSNEQNVGRVMAKGVISLLGDSGKIAVSTVPAQDNLNDRIAGLKAGLEGTSIEIVATGDNKGDDSETAATTSAILLANPDLDAVVCINATGSGVAAALKETGKVGKVKAVIADTLAPILDAVEDGTVDLTVAQKIYMQGYLLMQMLYARANPTPTIQGFLDGGLNPLPTNCDTGCDLVDKSSAKLFRS
tara:strand:+ start:138 stop:1124 length:987 start_codon:yes stop_codon:yes gene_type:complete